MAAAVGITTPAAAPATPRATSNVRSDEAAAVAMPFHKTWPVGAPAPPGEASGYIASSGLSFNAAPAASRQIFRACNVTQSSPRALQSVGSCLHRHHVLQYAVYQPAERFWTFQAIETGIFLTLAVGLAAASIWWTRDRLA